MDTFNRMMFGKAKKQAKQSKGGILSGIKNGKNNTSKQDLVDFVALETGMKKAYISKVIDQLFKTMGECLDKHESCVTIRGFGTFVAKERTIPARKYRIKDPNGNVHTGTTKEQTKIVVTFKKY